MMKVYSRRNVAQHKCRRLTQPPSGIPYGYDVLRDVPGDHRDNNALDPRRPRHRATGAGYVGATLVPTVQRSGSAGVVGRFAGAFSSSFRGLRLFPSQKRYLVPPTSKYPSQGATQTQIVGR